MRVSDTSTRGVVTPSEARGLLFSADRKSRFLASLGMTLVGAVTLLLILGAMMSTASAQILGPGPKQGKVQIGGWFAAVEHEVRHKFQSPVGQWVMISKYEYERAGLSARYGITNSTYTILNFGLCTRKSDRFRRDNESEREASAVLGIGGNVRFYRRFDFNLRAGGHFNKVVGFQVPYIGYDTRLAVAIDRAVHGRSTRLTFAAGVMYFRATVDWFDPYGQITRENTRSLAPVVSAVQVIADRFGFGIELTFGPITDIRLRTEIQL